MEAKVDTTREHGKDEGDHLRDISIWIDNYDDIFSDFDPRPLSERNISDDFLDELQKVSRESDFSVRELKLLIPEKLRNSDQEAVIIKRLQSHLRKKHQVLSKKKSSENKMGVLFGFSGMAMMVLAIFISSLKSERFIMHIPLVILEPAGWFLVWTSLERLVYISREEKPELDFYSKMAKSKIVFSSI